MKRSLRLPFTLLLLFALFTLLSCRSALHLTSGSVPESEPFSKPINPLNHTLLSLASLDVTEPQLKQHVDDLLHQSHLLNPYNRSRPATRNPIPTRNERILPEFRRALRNWIRNRRSHPQIMSDLVHLVKRPLDLHFSRPGPESEPDSPKPYSSCAVVGNSGILLENDNGDLIDGHDVVIRLNNARTKGYARHVGSKTTLSFVNSNILHLCARRHGCFCHPYGETVPIVMYICQPIHFLDIATCSSSHKSPLLITDPRFDVLCARIVKYYSLKRFVEETRKGLEEWGKAHDEKMFHYSSGMQAVVLATGICREVSVFGFGKSEEVKHHYHTNQKAELDLHDYAAEYEFYRDLVERPQVIPFLNESGFVVPPVVFYH